MKRQGGMALILSLMAVTLLATLGFAAVQQTTLGFLLSRNQIDLRIATTSAQNGLSAQLSTLDTLPVADFLPHGNNGLYRSEAYAEAPLWLQQSTWQVGGCRPVTYALTGSAAPACAIVELLRYRAENNYRAFRVTVRGAGVTNDSVVLIQSYAVLED